MINKRNLELFRLFPSGRVSFHSIVTGSGSLRCGSYQFAFRLSNTQTGESTKFSLFTTPVAIADVSSSGISSGLIGGSTNKSIILSISTTSDEILQYDKYQVAVIENTVGDLSIPTNISLSQFFPLEAQDFLFEYNANDKFDSVGIEEVAIDDAAIETFKTLESKNNRLIGGNTTYRYLNPGNPVVSYGSIIEVDVPVRQGFDKASSEVRGYFSGEVYRFAVTYWDEYGNFSTPVALDMANVAGNAATNSGFKDMKFPSRSSTGGRIVKTVDGITSVVHRGLRLAITNHPSWAKGIAIVRADRKKDILFQSPLVPTTVVQSPNAGNNYPGDGNTLPSTSGTIVPKNMFKAANSGIVRTSDRLAVEYKNNYDGYLYCKKVHVAFPPEALYTNGELPYATNIPSGNVKIEAIDYVSLRPIHFANLNTEVLDANVGNTIQSAVHCTYAAYDENDYASTSKTDAQIKAELVQSRPVVDEALSIDLIAEGQDKIVVTSIGTASPTSYFGDYEGLKITPDGDYNGFAPSNQKAAIVVTKSDRPDPSHSASSLALGAGWPSSTLETLSGKIDSANFAVDGTKDRNLLNLNNANNGSDPLHYLEIVNFKKGLKDDRYGNPNTVQEFISTGSSYSFEASFSSATPVEIDVFGGDCFISPFTFKVQDSVYGVSNTVGSPNSFTVADWGGVDYENPASTNISRAIPYKAASSCIGVYLESEVNGYIDDKILYKSTNNNNSLEKIVVNWNNAAISAGEIVYFQDRYYYSITPIEGTDFPGKGLGLSKLNVNNIGFKYLDLGKSYDGYAFPPLSDVDAFLATKSYREAKVGFQYLYNHSYSAINRSKYFISSGTSGDVFRTKYSSRLFFSDVKILQTNIEGFSRFRVLNFYDLEESKGSITKIVNHKGNLVGVQESAFCYIPFDTNQIEAQDGISLSIRSGSVVGLPQYVDDYGSRYIRSVLANPYGLYFADIDNSSVIVVNEGVSRVNDAGIDKLIREYCSPLINKDIDDRDVMFYSDPKTSEIVLKFQSKGILIDQSDSVVDSVIRMHTNTEWNYGYYINGIHYVFGYQLDDITREKIGWGYYRIGEGDNLLFGTGLSSYIKSIVNEDYITPKVIDIIKVNSLYSQQSKISSYSRGIQTGLYGEIGFALSEPDREAWFLINKIRDDETKQRLRGDHFVVELFLSDAEKLISFATKYRISDRRI